MLTIHFSVREAELEGFTVLFTRLVKEMDMPYIKHFKVEDNPVVQFITRGEPTSDYGVEKVRQCSFQTTMPMVSINFLTQLLGVYLVHSDLEEHEGARIILTDSDGDEFQEFRC